MVKRTGLPVIAEVEGLGRVVEVKNDFYNELLQLKGSGARPISPRDEAYARLMTRGKEDIGRTYGTRTSAGFEYVNGQLPILRLESRLLTPELARQAVEANRKGHYLSTASTKEYADSLKQAEQDKNKEPRERSVIILPSKSEFKISDKEYWEIFESIFKDQAKAYFELNGPISVYLANERKIGSQNGTILSQLWFRDLGCGSELYGDDGDLDDAYGLRGVLK